MATDSKYSPDCLAQLAAKKESDLRRKVAKPWRIKYLWRNDPDRLKVLALIAAELGDVQRFAAGMMEDHESEEPASSHLPRLNNLIASISPTIDRDSAWEYVGTLRGEKLWITPISYIRARLALEAVRTQVKIGWKDYFGEADLLRLREQSTIGKTSSLSAVADH